MASSGTVTLKTQSVDYGGGRGHITLTNVIGWAVDNNGNISFSLISSSDTAGGYWGLCYGSAPYYIHLVPQVSYNGGSSWSNLDDRRHYVNSVCTEPASISTYVNTIAMSRTLVSQLGSYNLSQDCRLRFLYYMDPAPAPSVYNQWAFPNSSYSEVSQVPVDVDVSWTATLRYNSNGGSGAPSDQSVTTEASSQNFTIPDTVPTKARARFEGWSTNASSTTAQYHGGDTFTVNKNNPTVTLYAIWTEYYRVGDVRYNGVYKTTNRSGGKCHIRQNGSWVEMLSIDAGHTTPVDPPNRRKGGSWQNQYRIGAP